MKTSKILTSTLALSAIGLVDTPNSPYKLKDNFSKQVLKDTREIRKVRDSYTNQPKKEQKQYDNKVKKISECFSKTISNDKWSETQAILDIHDCSLQNDYPNINPLDDKWSEKIKSARAMGAVFSDHIGTPSLLNQYLIFVNEILNKPLTSKISNVTIDHKMLDNNPTILVDNKPVVRMSYYNGNSDSSNCIKLHRTNTIQPDLEKNYANKDAELLNSDTHILVEHTDRLANTLLNGDFKNQDAAVDLLLDYKILTCLPFSIENSRGTQFKNIVKMNYLTEAIKKKYPEKISQNLNIPHIITGNKKIDHANFSKSPEIAITLLSPSEFKDTQKKQIRHGLENQNDEL